MIKDMKFKVISKDKNKVHFNYGDLNIYLYILEEDIFLVFIPTDDHTLLNKNWTITPGLEDMPLEERDRFDLSPFSLLKYESIDKGDSLLIVTYKIKANIKLI